MCCDTIATLIESIFILFCYEALFKKKFIVNNKLRTALFSVSVFIVSYWATSYFPYVFNILIILISAVILLSYFVGINIFVSLVTYSVYFTGVFIIEIGITQIVVLITGMSFDQVLSTKSIYIVLLPIAKVLEFLIFWLARYLNINLSRFKVFNAINTTVTYFTMQISIFALLLLSINGVKVKNNMTVFYVLLSLILGILLVVGYLNNKQKVKEELEKTRIEKENETLLKLTKELENEIETRKAYEEKTHKLAYYDSITDLPNRILIKDTLESELQKAEKDNSKVALLLVDIDNFKAINDTFGHSFGDLFLKEFASKLKYSLNPEYIIARYGEDEFLIIINDALDVDNIKKVASNLLNLFRVHWKINDSEFYSTVSIGISLYPQDGIDFDILIKFADLAMFNAKKSGKDNYKLYNPSMYSEVVQRTVLEKKLRKAINNNDFIPFYQPQIELKTGRIIGFEALIRWIDENGEMIMPNQFIPLAEQTGLIVPIGKQMLRMACNQNKKWQQLGYGCFPIAVNVSSLELKYPNFLENVKEILSETELDAQYLEIEITESVIMENFEANCSILNSLKGFGVKISLDDFGTGYSSLSYLSKLPINTLKIDKSFVDCILEDSSRKVIIESILELSKKMGLGTIAEGVERKEQMDYLIEKECDMVQGYFVSRPLPAEKADGFLKMRANNTL